MSRSLFLEAGNSVINSATVHDTFATGASMTTYNLLGLMALGIMIALSVQVARNG